MAVCFSVPCPRGGPVRRVSRGQGSSKDTFLPREWLGLVAPSLFFIWQEVSSLADLSEGGIVFWHFPQWKCRGALFHRLGLWICSPNSCKYLHYCLEAIYMSHVPSSWWCLRSWKKSRNVPLVMYSLVLTISWNRDWLPGLNRKHSGMDFAAAALGSTLHFVQKQLQASQNKRCFEQLNSVLGCGGTSFCCEGESLMHKAVNAHSFPFCK